MSFSILSLNLDWGERSHHHNCCQMARLVIPHGVTEGWLGTPMGQFWDIKDTAFSRLYSLDVVMKMTGSLNRQG